MVFLGADPNQLTTAADQLERVAQQADAIHARLSQRLRAAAHASPQAGAYYNRLGTVVLPTVAETGAILHGGVRKLRDQAVKQTKASAAAGAGVPQGRRRGSQRNVFDRADDTFFSFHLDGAKRIVRKTGAVNPNDPAIYVFRVFIPQRDVPMPVADRLGKTIVGWRFGGMGDDRGFDSTPERTSKAVVAWRPSDGAVSFTSYDSRTLDGKRVEAVDIVEGRHFTVWKARPGELGFSYSAQNSIYPNSTPAIDGDVYISSDPDGRGRPNVRLAFDRDWYPAAEAYAYYPDGRVVTLAQDAESRPEALLPPSNDRRAEFFNGGERDRPTERVPVTTAGTVPGTYPRTVYIDRIIPVKRLGSP